MKLPEKIFNYFVLATFLLLMIPVPTKAAGASLYLSPTSGTKYVGDKFSVFVYVSTPQAANTFDVYLSTGGILQIVGVATGGSICTLFPQQPSFTATLARLRCGLPTPGYTGTRGYIGAITVKANSQGSGTVSVVSPSSVLANDGSGTNILSSLGSANYNIQPPPAAAPTISSTSHPNQDSWYKNKNVTLNFTGSGSAYSYSLDQNPDGTPDETSEGSATTKTYNDLGDGVWYFHARVKSNNGNWSGTAHFRIQIDTTPPEAFTPEADPKTNANKRPIIAFNTTDSGSGIDHYEIKIDDGNWEKAVQPYQIPKISSGNHKISVKAVDKAGNERVGQVEVSIAKIASPTILEPSNGATLPYSNHLFVKGKSLANYKVRIYLDGKEIGTTKADKDGNFEFVYKQLLSKGKHELYAVALNPDNIESPKSEIVKFTVDPQSYLIFGRTVPGSFIFISFAFILILILILMILFALKNRKLRKKAREIIEELEAEIEKDLKEEKVSKKTQEKIEGEFEEAEEKV